MYKTKFIAIFIGAAVVAAGLVFFLRSKGPETFKFLNVVSGPQENQPEKKDTLVSSETKKENISGYKAYENSAYKFSLKYPEKLGVTEFDEGEGAHTVLFQEQGGSGGFQIFISEFDEEGPITLERIKKDIPDMAIEDLQNIIFGSRTSEREVGLPAGSPTSGGVPALIFFSRDESLGRTREVWFVWPKDPKLVGNYLYQVTARADFDAELSKIMATFRFNE